MPSQDGMGAAFLRTLEVYGEMAIQNSVLILTTDSDFYRYVKQAIPESRHRLPTMAPRAAMQ
jgi:membrane protease subunit HflC